MTKKIKITYPVCGMNFKAETSNISEAYEYIKAIVKREKTRYPNQEITLSEYMNILVRMQNGELLKHENYIFALEIVQEETQNG